MKCHIFHLVKRVLPIGLDCKKRKKCQVLLQPPIQFEITLLPRSFIPLQSIHPWGFTPVKHIYTTHTDYCICQDRSLPSTGRIRMDPRRKEHKMKKFLTKKIKQWLICVQLNFHDTSWLNGNCVTLTKDWGDWFSSLKRKGV